MPTTGPRTSCIQKVSPLLFGRRLLPDLCSQLDVGLFVGYHLLSAGTRFLDLLATSLTDARLQAQHLQDLVKKQRHKERNLVANLEVKLSIQRATTQGYTTSDIDPFCSVPRLLLLGSTLNWLSGSLILFLGYDCLVRAALTHELLNCFKQLNSWPDGYQSGLTEVCENHFVLLSNFKDYNAELRDEVCSISQSVSTLFCIQQLTSVITGDQ